MANESAEAKVLKLSARLAKLEAEVALLKNQLEHAVGLLRDIERRLYVPPPPHAGIWGKRA